jgi:hypothetical protein
MFKQLSDFLQMAPCWLYMYEKFDEVMSIHTLVLDGTIVMSILEICGTNQGPDLPHSKMLLWS